MNQPWYWQLGFEVNPFSIKPAALSNDVIAHKTERIIERISNGDVQFVEAPLGMGKTTMLKKILAQFGGRGKVIYASSVMGENLDVKSLLKNATLPGKLFGAMPGDMILLVDEAQNISKEDAEEIDNFIKSGNIKAVTFFGTSYNSKLFTDELNNALSGNVAMLSYLTPDQAVELVRSRVGNLKLLPDYVIRELYGRTSGNTRRLLQNCEDICRKAVELSIPELTISDVGTLLKVHEPKIPEEPKEKKELPQKKPRKIKTATTKKQPRKKTAKAAKKQKTDDYNLENIRTYEEEMSTIKNLE